jgi:hypothetical protein
MVLEAMLRLYPGGVVEARLDHTASISHRDERERDASSLASMLPLL